MSSETTQNNKFITKFNYTKINRVDTESGRRYSTPDGEKLPSVTTILAATKSEESKKALNEWRNNVGIERAKQITTEAANRGTKMHNYLEHYVKTGELKEKPNNPFSWSSYYMAKKIIELGLQNVDEFWGTEIGLYFPKLYAGTTDLVGVHKGRECILDFKQSNKPKKREYIEDYFLQTVFYGTAHNEVYGTDINKGVILICIKPNTDEQQNLISEPEYQEFIIEDNEWKHYEKLMWKKLEEYYSK